MEESIGGFDCKCIMQKFMERFQPIELVKKQLAIKEEQCKHCSDPIIKKKIECIRNMLNNERCFFNINIDVAIEVLSFLGFDDETAFELYDKLTDYEIFKGNFEFRNSEE